MPRVKGPNGLAIPVSEQVAEALLKRQGDYELVSDESASAKKSPAKKATAKPSE